MIADAVAILVGSIIGISGFLGMFSRCAKNVHLFFIFYWLTWIAVRIKLFLRVKMFKNLLVGVPYACCLIAGSITVFIMYPDISDEGILSFHGEIWAYYLLGIIIMILGICLLINFIYALILCPRYCCSKRKNTVKPLEEKN